jgi:threonine synthase
MNYVSTRGQIEPVSFQQAVLMGLADDGGLIVPESIPDLRDRIDAWRGLDYPQLAMEIIQPFTTDIPRADLQRLIDTAYGPSYFVNEPHGPGLVAPVVPVGDLHIMELWHGPTLAFKDVALQLLGGLFEYILAHTGGRLNILAATSGDTGSAAIHGVRGRDRIAIFVMHPAGRVSPIQQLQMTTVTDGNVHNLAVDGSFDDCQAIMKTIAADVEFKRRYDLGAVNSVNWARVLAQIVYYIHGAFVLQERTGCDAIRVAVPTGNFGDILAGWYAIQMGAPIEQLILATNENDILTRFFTTGRYALGQVSQTLSPSMDIQVASNFERYLYYHLGQDPVRLAQTMAEFSRTGQLAVAPRPDGVDPAFRAVRANTPAVLDVIGRYHREHSYLLDPHTACGVVAAEQASPAGSPVFCLATAHPAKFPHAIKQATGQADLAQHPAIDALADLPSRCSDLPADAQAIRQFIQSHTQETSS